MPARRLFQPVDFDFFPDLFEFAAFPFPFGAAFLEQFLHYGFLAGLSLETAAQRMNIFAHLFERQLFLPRGHARESAPGIGRRQYQGSAKG
jgi:hypothetical protein